MSNTSKRPHIERALVLNIAELIALGAVVLGARVVGVWTWRCEAFSEKTARFASVLRDGKGTLLVTYSASNGGKSGSRVIHCRIRLSTTPLPFGGERVWMHCPYTNRRATKLYKFAGIDYFCHRTAIRPLPTYASQRVSGFDRVQNQRLRILRLLNHRGGLYDIPSKPKRMRWRTFEKLSDREETLAELDINLQVQLMQKMKAKIGL